MMDTNDDRYYTSDSVLATWLLMNNHEPVEVRNSTFPSIFIFENHNSCLKELIAVYNLGKASGNIHQFYTSYRRILGMIKGRY